MKTTLNLSDDLVARAKSLAIKERSTLTKLIEEGLALRLSRKHVRARKKVRELPVSPRSGGLRPGITGTSNRSMFDAADS